MEVKMKKILLLIILTVISTPSSATLITFDELESGRHYNDYTQATYSHDNFILTTTQAFNSIGMLHPSYGTSTGLHAAGVSADVELKRIDNALFNINSIDLLIGLYNRYDDEIPVYFTGLKSNGVTVYQVFSLPYDISKYSTFNFDDSFTELTSLTWQQGAIYHSFDNVNLNNSTQVPEPYTIILLIPALVLVFKKRYT